MTIELKLFILEFPIKSSVVLLQKLSGCWMIQELVQIILRELPKLFITKLSEQIVHLKSMVESLYQSCQSKDLTINGLSSDLATLQNEVLLVRGQLEAQVTKCVTGERIIGHKDSEIQRFDERSE